MFENPVYDFISKETNDLRNTTQGRIDFTRDTLPNLASFDYSRTRLQKLYSDAGFGIARQTFTEIYNDILGIKPNALAISSVRDDFIPSERIFAPADKKQLKRYRFDVLLTQEHSETGETRSEVRTFYISKLTSMRELKDMIVEKSSFVDSDPVWMTTRTNRIWAYIDKSIIS